MNENKKCPKCGATIADEWKHELCPACLMNAGFATGDSAQGSPPVRASDETKASENTYAPPPNAPLSIEDVRKLFPQLEIIEQIGRGGMGVVYKARQPQLDRMVALKILSVGPGSSGAHSNFAERFSREARALARLNHPNIVSVFDFGVTRSGDIPVPGAAEQAGDKNVPPPCFYFIMEYVDGANLRQMIAAKQIAPEAALTIVPKVCEALQFAHDEGILHRDIKPENILIDKKGRVKIADFGLAKLIGDDTVDHSLTGTQQIMGTPRYMAPEQFENTKTVDHRADIYSLGVVFYEMLTGEIPMGRFAVPSKKVHIDVRLDEVVLRSLEKEPELRYQHASEIKSDVENITQHHGAGASLPPNEAGSPASIRVSPQLPATGKSAAANFQSSGIARRLGLVAIIIGVLLLLAGFKGYNTAADRAIASGIMDFQNPGRAAAKSIALHFATSTTVLFFAGVGAVCGGLFARRTRGTEAGSAAFWNSCITVTGGIAAAILLLYGISAQMLHGICRVDFLALPLVLFAASAAVVRLISNSAAGRPASADTIPELALVVMCILSAAMPWDSFAVTSGNPWDIVGSGWGTNHGTAFSILYVVLGFLLLVTGGRKTRPVWRTLIVLIGGIAGFAIALHFATHPIPHQQLGWTAPGELKATYRIQTGCFVSAAIALLTVLVAAIQLRNRLVATDDAEPAAKVSDEPRLSRCALIGVIWAPCVLNAWWAWQHCVRQYFDKPDVFASYSTGYLVLGLTAFILAVTAPFGATILGGVSLAQIKRSDGKIYGLPLAAAALLFQPLVVLGLFTAYLLKPHAIELWFDGWRGMSPNEIAEARARLGDALNFSGFNVLIVLAVCSIAVWFAWRKIFGPKLPAAGNSDDANSQSLEPRLSTCALIGVIWAPFTLLGWWSWQMCVRQYFDNPVQFATYDPLFRTLGVGTFILAATAWLGSTLLGGIAIAQIKRSGGKLYGLPLAACSLLFHPLLALGSLAFYITNLICFAIAFNLRTPVQPPPGAPPVRDLGVIDFAVLDSLAALVVMFFAARFAWRKIAGVKSEAADPRTSVKRAAVAMLVGGIASAIMTLFLASETYGNFEKGQFTLPGMLIRYAALAGFGALAFFAVRGALKMMEFEDYPAGKRAAICSIVSNFGIITLPAGIYALIVLGRPEVKALFTTVAANPLSPEQLAARRRAVKKALLVAGIVIGVCWLLSVAFCSVHQKPVRSPPRSPISVPSPGAITSGFGAEFTVPAGQVAVFEILAQRDGKLEPVPPHCAFVMAPADHAVKGSFRWSREPNQTGNGKRWGIEVTSGAGNGKTGGLLLADDLDAATGASGLVLGSLTPNEEAIHGSGKVRLRVTTLAHNSKTGGSGVAHTDWRIPKVPTTGNSGSAEFQQLEK